MGVGDLGRVAKTPMAAPAMTTAMTTKVKTTRIARDDRGRSFDTGDVGDSVAVEYPRRSRFRGWGSVTLLTSWVTLAAGPCPLVVSALDIPALGSNGTTGVPHEEQNFGSSPTSALPHSVQNIGSPGFPALNRPRFRNRALLTVLRGKGCCWSSDCRWLSRQER